MFNSEEGQLAKPMYIDEPVRFSIRPYASTDSSAVRDLVACDGLPGEGVPPSELPIESIDGREIFIATDLADGQVCGAMCLSVRRPDDAGLIHWLHGREDFHTIAALLSFSRAHFGPRTLYAFVKPITRAGVPGIPLSRRPATVRALTAAGFTPSISQHYLQLELTESPPQDDEPIADVTLLNNYQGWRFVVFGTDGRIRASALLSKPDTVSGTATLWHFAVHPAYRRQGIGSRLMTQCLEVAADRGASRVSATVDINADLFFHLLSTYGFELIDTLATYQRRR